MPKITRLELFHIAVPLKKRIRHASHERASSDNLVARVVLDDGTSGFGEGVPRSYVTGETIDTAFEMLSTFDAARAIGNPASFGELVGRLKELTLPSIANDPRGMFGNAARAALEVATLDAFSRFWGESIGAALRIAANSSSICDQPHKVRYSGAITAESKWKERISAVKMRAYGFHQVKLKVAVAGQDDPARLRVIRRLLGGKTDIRIDANEGWNASELIEKVGPLRAYRPSCLEQPVPHSQVDELTELRPTLGIPVMLDESLCGFPDGLRAIERKTADIFNVRISKCGGLLPSLKLMELAQSAGLTNQLGCHPGETGILSAAGRQLASHLKTVRYLEGSYDNHILAQNVIREDITFRYGGWGKPLEGPGLGVTVDLDLLAAMTARRHEVSYE